MNQPDGTHDPSLDCWVDSALRHPEFPVQNLPLGLFAPAGAEPRLGVAIGNRILDLRAVADSGLLPPAATAAARDAGANALLSLPAVQRQALRTRLSAMLCDWAYESRLRPFLHEARDCTLLLPARIGDYTDFYAGIHHAVNVGRLFRPDQPLMPNYRHVPIGYHGRASSIRPSDVPVVRPHGQVKPSAEAPPLFSPSRKLDYELELGFWIGPGNALGRPIPAARALEHLAGVCLLNDWSARDIQAWEYQPLGPFLGKNFHTTISPWIVTTEALAPFWIAQPERPSGDPVPLPYLTDAANGTRGCLAIELTLSISSSTMREAGMRPFVVARTEARHLYWTVAQLITHHASGGCNLQPGDLLGSGTISGTEPDEFGSLLEATANGAQPIGLPDGSTRTFLQDGDEVIIRAQAAAPGAVSIGFGECRAMVAPAPAAQP